MANGDFGTQYLFGISIGYQEGASPAIRFVLTVDYAAASNLKVRTLDGGTLFLAPSADSPTRDALVTISLADAAGRQWRVLTLGGVKLTQARLDDGRSWALIVVDTADASPANYRATTVDGGNITTVFTGTGDYRALLTDSAADVSATPLVRNVFGGRVAFNAVTGGSALLSGGGAGFTPAQASVPLELWYHAPDLALAQGATPTNLPDLSGKGRHATTFPGCIYNEDTLNGRGGININGASEYIRTPSFAVNQPVSVFLVMKSNAFVNNGRIMDGGTTANQAAIIMSTPNYVLFAGTGVAASRLPGAESIVPGLLFIRAKFNGASSKLKVNSTSEATGNPGSIGVTSGITIGNGGAAVSFPCNIDFGTILVFAGITTNDDDTNIQAFLKDTYRTTRLAVFDGDSLTSGFGVAAGSDYPAQTIPLLVSQDWAKVNFGAGSKTLATMVSSAAVDIDTIIDSGYTNAFVCLLGGINDLALGASAASVYANLQSYWSSRRAAGYEVVAFTILPASAVSGGNETARLAVNALIRGDATKYDALADIAADARLQNTADLTYFQADGVHPTAAGAAVMADIAAAAINSLP